MDIDRYKRTHVEILGQIDQLRALIQSGIGEQADAIAGHITLIASGIKFHLAAEDSVLYPALLAAGDARTGEMSRRYQSEMTGIAAAFGEFVGRWRVGSRIAADPEVFRREANDVFRALFERLQREDRELYPAAEKL